MLRRCSFLDAMSMVSGRVIAANAAGASEPALPPPPARLKTAVNQNSEPLLGALCARRRCVRKNGEIHQPACGPGQRRAGSATRCLGK